ncbi:MAG: class II aldolase/adducin family protein, partial [Spirochaetia bacterium]|nr:class II aldolase/adducin family protein [Spirochaetia bacterium]
MDMKQFEHERHLVAAFMTRLYDRQLT